MQSQPGSSLMNRLTTLRPSNFGNATLDCHVLGSDSELYDCCTPSAQRMCQTVAFFDLTSAAVILIAFIFLLFRSPYLKTQTLLCYVFGFLIVTFLMRGTFYMTSAYPESAIETYFLLRSAPCMDLYCAMTAYLFYVYSSQLNFSYYSRKRLINDFTGEFDKSFRVDFHVFYVMALIVLALLYFFFLMLSLKFGTLNPLNVSLTVLYGLHFIAFIYLYYEYYELLKQLLPAVAKQAKKHFIQMLAIGETIIFLRMVFMSVTDMAQIGKQKGIEQEDQWPGLLLGKAVSEIVAAYLILALVYLTYRVEALINSYFLHGCKYTNKGIENFKRVKQSDLKDGLDSVFHHLTDLEEDLEQFEHEQSLYQEKLKQVDYSFLDESIKPQIVNFISHFQTKFEDLLYSSIDRIRKLQAKRVSLHNTSQKLSHTLEEIDGYSIPIMDKLMKDLEILRAEVVVSGDESLTVEKMEFQELERQWQVLEDNLRKEDAKLAPTCQQNFRALNQQLEPVKAILLQLDQIYCRVLNNPYLNSNYMQKLRLQLNKDLEAVEYLENEVISKHRESLDELQTLQLRRVNKRCVDGLQTLLKVEKNELSLLKDCNILFSFESKVAELKSQLQELKTQLTHEESSGQQLTDDQRKTLLEVRFSIDHHDIYQIDQDYFQLNMNKRQLQFDTCPTFIQNFELLMYRLVKSEEKVLDIVNQLNQVQAVQSQNQDKVRLFNQLRSLIKDVDVELTGQVQTELNAITRVLSDYSQLGNEQEQIKAMQQAFADQVANEVQRKLIKLQTSAMTANQLNNQQIEGLLLAVQSLEREMKRAFEEFKKDLVKQFEQQRDKVEKIRKQIDLRGLGHKLERVENLKVQYTELVQTAEPFLKQTLPAANLGKISQSFRELYAFNVRILEIESVYLRLTKSFNDYLQRETLTKEHLTVYTLLLTQITTLLSYIQQLKVLPLFPDPESLPYPFQKATQLKKQITALQGYSDFNHRELKKCQRQIVDVERECQRVVEDRVREVIEGVTVDRQEYYVSPQVAEFELLQTYKYPNAKTEAKKNQVMGEREERQREVKLAYIKYEQQMKSFSEQKGQIMSQVRDHSNMVSRLQAYYQSIEALELAIQALTYHTNNLKDHDQGLATQWLPSMRAHQELELMLRRLITQSAASHSATSNQLSDFTQLISDRFSSLTQEFEHLNSQTPQSNQQELQILDRKKEILAEKSKLASVKEFLNQNLDMPELDQLRKELESMHASDQILRYNEVEGYEERVQRVLIRIERANRERVSEAKRLMEEVKLK